MTYKVINGSVILLITLIFLNYLTFPAQVGAQEQVRVTKEDLTRVGKQLYAPGTEGATVDYCTLPTAATMRQEIVELLRKGLSDEEVIESMVDKYGEIVLASPRKEGFNLSLWTLPYIIIGIALLVLSCILWRKFRNRSKGSNTLIKEELFEEISEEDYLVVYDHLKQYLKGKLQGTTEELSNLYHDLTELENDYLMDKISTADYENLRKTICFQIICKEGREERE